MKHLKRITGPVIVLALAGLTRAADFVDEFDGTLANWVQTPSSPAASWTTSSGTLMGFYTTNAGSQTNTQSTLLLADSLQPAGDFEATARFRYVANRQYPNLGFAYATFGIYLNGNQKFSVGVGYGAWNWYGGTVNQLYVGVQTYYPWTVAYENILPINWNTNDWQSATLRRVGQTYTMLFNGTVVGQWVDTHLNGAGKLGLHVYGEAVYDSFSVSSLPANDPCAGLQQALAEANQTIANMGVQLAALNVENTELTQELAVANQSIAALNAEVSQLSAENAALSQEHTAVLLGLGEIRRLLSLPQGRRATSAHFSGSIGEELNEILRMLVSPPGQNVIGQK